MLKIQYSFFPYFNIRVAFEKHKHLELVHTLLLAKPSGCVLFPRFRSFVQKVMCICGCCVCSFHNFFCFLNECNIFFPFSFHSNTFFALFMSFLTLSRHELSCSLFLSYCLVCVSPGFATFLLMFHARSFFFSLIHSLSLLLLIVLSFSHLFPVEICSLSRLKDVKLNTFMQGSLAKGRESPSGEWMDGTKCV